MIPVLESRLIRVDVPRTTLMAGGEITRSTRRVNKRNQEKERIKRREKPVAFLSGTERYRSTPGERAPKCDPHAANPARTRVRQRGSDWGTEGGQRRGKNDGWWFPDTRWLHIYTYVYIYYIYTAETHANAFVHRIVIAGNGGWWFSDPMIPRPAYVKKGGNGVAISRFFANKFRGSLGTEIVAFLVPIARLAAHNDFQFVPWELVQPLFE